ncbi:MAG: hypothetical protein JWO84_685 [Parcubacteria group bacterium]|nr:hypothetical protein [Parcubacteria group bacterium]
MNILRSGSLTWWQISILKVAVLLIGIAIGANWPLFFAPYTLKLVLVGIVLGIYVACIWFKR